mmetsp:Transcript_126121/g.218453  ORF Transcript_126121/g.218453 Transcript_126121/m.218453 type:complete len:87 (+) Transcript_126121:1-261(+)
MMSGGDVWKDPFLKPWAATWDGWQSYAKLWIASSAEDNMNFIIMLRIPESFVEGGPIYIPFSICSFWLLWRWHTDKSLYYEPIHAL